MPLADRISDRYVQLVESLGAERGFGYGWKAQVARQLGISQGYLGKVHRREQPTIGWRSVARAAIVLRIGLRYWTDPELSGDWRHYEVSLEELWDQLSAARAERSETHDFAAFLQDRLAEESPSLARRNATLPSRMPDDGFEGIEGELAIAEVAAKVMQALAFPSGSEAPPAFESWRRRRVEFDEGTRDRLERGDPTLLRELGAVRAMGWLFLYADKKPKPAIYDALFSLVQISGLVTSDVRKGTKSHT